MKREIKFRAWDSEHKCMMTLPEDIPIYYESDNGFHSGRVGEHGWVEYILMQNTGVKDCNGNDIYEGDIISIFDYYNQDHLVEHPFIDLYRMVEINKSSIGEIVGNIYETPELLDYWGNQK